MFVPLKLDSQYFVFYQLYKERMSSLSLEEMTITRTKQRKNILSSRAGPREKLLVLSLVRSLLMEEKALSFLGTKSTE